MLRDEFENRAGQAAWSSWTNRCQHKQACFDDEEAQRKPDGDDGCREAREEPEEKIVIGEDVLPSDDGYDPSSLEVCQRAFWR